MHAAVRGLVWLASNLAERRPGGVRRRRRALGRRAVAALAGGAGAFARRAARRRALRGALGGARAGAPELLAELLAGAPEPPCARARSGRRRRETLVRERLPAASAGFAHACHAVTGGNPFLLGALVTQLAADDVAPDDEAAARLETFGSEQVARVVERQLARLPTAPDRWRARSPCSAPALRCATPPALPGSTSRRRPAPPTRCGPPGCSTTGRGLTLGAPADRQGRCTRACRRASGRSARDAAALLARARRPRTHRAAPAAHRAGGRRGHRRALRDAASGPAARRPTERGGVPAPRRRRAAAGRRRGRRRAARAGLALAAYMQPDAYDLLQEAAPPPATAHAARHDRLSGARALGLIGRSIEPSRSARRRSSGARISGRAARAARGGARRQRPAAVSTIAEARRYASDRAGMRGARAVASDARRRRHAREPRRPPRPSRCCARCSTAGRAGRRSRLPAQTLATLASDRRRRAGDRARALRRR